MKEFRPWETAAGRAQVWWVPLKPPKRAEGREWQERSRRPRGMWCAPRQGRAAAQGSSSVLEVWWTLHSYRLLVLFVCVVLEQDPAWESQHANTIEGYFSPIRL